MVSVLYYTMSLLFFRVLAHCACLEGACNKRRRLALKVAHGDSLPSFTHHQVIARDHGDHAALSYLSARAGSARSQVDLTEF